MHVLVVSQELCIACGMVLYDTSGVLMEVYCAGMVRTVAYVKYGAVGCQHCGFYHQLGFWFGMPGVILACCQVDVVKEKVCHVLWENSRAGGMHLAGYVHEYCALMTCTLP